MNHSATTTNAVKRRKIVEHPQPLIPGLPDDVALICLSRVNPLVLYTVCHSWRRLIYSPSFPPFLSIYALLEPSQTYSDNTVGFGSFDPVSAKWVILPPPPLNLLLRHPSFISRSLPIQTVSVSGNFVLLAATAEHLSPALTGPLIFNPVIGKWVCGPPLATPRRWCAAGATRGAVYVASGVGSHYNLDVAKSVEKWDPLNGWVKMSGLRDGKFSREAIEAVGWRGKLCMVNVKGDAAKEGIVYDVVTDTWREMPEGMLVGWRGPAAAMGEETIYAVDESKGALREYDHESDRWVEIMENEMLKGAEHMAAAAGRLCIVRGGGDGIAVVDVVAKPPGLVVVENPVGFQVLDVRILPRVSYLGSELHRY